MPKRTNIGNDAARMARAAAADMANLQRALKRAEDSFAGLNRTIKVPNTTPQHRTIKGSRSPAPLIFSLLGGALGSYLSYDIKYGSDGSGSQSGGDDSGYFSSYQFMRSSGQFAADLTRGMLRGQRIL